MLINIVLIYKVLFYIELIYKILHSYYIINNIYYYNYFHLTTVIMTNFLFVGMN